MCSHSAAAGPSPLRGEDPLPLPSRARGARRDAQEALEHAAQRLDGVDTSTRDQLAAFKVEVATTYASIPALCESEGRLTAHLVRIEKKLDSLGFGRSALGGRP